MLHNNRPISQGPNIQNGVSIFISAVVNHLHLGNHVSSDVPLAWVAGTKSLQSPCNSMTFVFVSSDRHHFGNLVPKVLKNSNTAKRNHLSV